MKNLLKAFQNPSRLSELLYCSPQHVKNIEKMENEFYRRGNFKRIFPTPNSRKYLSYFKNSSSNALACIEFLERKYNVSVPVSIITKQTPPSIKQEENRPRCPIRISKSSENRVRNTSNNLEKVYKCNPPPNQKESRSQSITVHRPNTIPYNTRRSLSIDVEETNKEYVVRPQIAVLHPPHVNLNMYVVKPKPLPLFLQKRNSNCFVFNTEKPHNPYIHKQKVYNDNELFREYVRIKYPNIVTSFQ